MSWIGNIFHTILAHSPEIAIFFSLSVGYWIGKIRFGSFQLGGVAGSLLVAVIVSQVGVSIDPGVKNILFALFIYAVGYESGPQFFRSLNRQSLREIALAAIVAITGLITVVVTAKLFGFDKGLAAGIAAGGLTQSAIIGTAGDALAKLGLNDLQTNVAIGYAVTYVFGSFGTIIICVNILPKFMGHSIHDDAIKAEVTSEQGNAVLGPGQQRVVSELAGRLYKIDLNQQKTVQQLEQDTGSAITIERLKRGNNIIPITPQLILQKGDVLLVVGRRAEVLKAAPQLGHEVYGIDGMSLVMQRRDIVVTDEKYNNKKIADIRDAMDASIRHGIFILSINREGKNLPPQPDTIIELGDVITLYGSEGDIKRITSIMGSAALIPSDKTDFVYMGAGLVVGLLIGLVTVKLGNLPVTLGSGGGALLSGLLFGWYQSKKKTFGSMPSGAIVLLKDLGLAGFVVAVGLSSGLQAVQTIEQRGPSIFVAGLIVTIVPLLLSMLIGRYLLRYQNTAVFAGALAGSRSANPAFGEVLNYAGNAVPTVPFAITYGLANVFLTLLGPLIVSLV